MEDAVSASNSGSSGQVVVAGAGYAGLHVALRLTAQLRNHPKMELTLVDRHDYHQVITELPRVAGGTRAAAPILLRATKGADAARWRLIQRPRSVTAIALAGAAAPLWSNAGSAQPAGHFLSNSRLSSTRAYQFLPPLTAAQSGPP
jgi:2-polyprenyl-6-methoxyphenol hydroxylase-like FAD-dependent oxidoreductase